MVWDNKKQIIRFFLCSFLCNSLHRYLNEFVITGTFCLMLNAVFYQAVVRLEDIVADLNWLN